MRRANNPRLGWFKVLALASLGFGAVCFAPAPAQAGPPWGYGYGGYGPYRHRGYGPGYYGGRPYYGGRGFYGGGYNYLAPVPVVPVVPLVRPRYYGGYYGPVLQRDGVRAFDATGPLNA